MEQSIIIKMIDDYLTNDFLESITKPQVARAK